MVEKNERFERTYFDSGNHMPGHYAAYDKTRFYPAFKAMVRKTQALINPKIVLDLGCAKGFLVEILKNKNLETFGADVSHYAIGEAPENIRKNLFVVDLNLEELPFEPDSFDLVFCMGTLEYLYNQHMALQEIKRVLKQGGYILITTLNYIPENDNLRLYARKKEDWNRAFKNLGFHEQHDKAKAIFSAYVKKIALFDLKYALFDTKTKKNFKKQIAAALYPYIPDSLISNYLLYKQLRSGYLMLGYKKNKA